MTLILGAPRANHVLRLKDLVCCTPEGFQEFEKPDDPIAKARREDQQFDPNECKSQISRPSRSIRRNTGARGGQSRRGVPSGLGRVGGAHVDLLEDRRAAIGREAQKLKPKQGTRWGFADDPSQLLRR